MSESFDEKLKAAIDGLEPEPGAKERMLDHIRQKAAEQTVEKSGGNTFFKSLFQHKYRRLAFLSVACLIVIVGIWGISRSLRPRAEKTRSEPGERISEMNSSAEKESGLTDDPVMTASATAEPSKTAEPVSSASLTGADTAEQTTSVPESIQEPSSRDSASRRARTLTERVELAPEIFTAKQESGPDENGMYHFTVLRTFRGELSDSQFVLGPGFTPDREAEYLFFAELFANVMTDTVFLVIDDYILEKNGALCSLSISDLKEQSYADILAKMPAIVQALPPVSEERIKADYIHSDDIRVIAEEADTVISATVEAIRRTLEDRVWCRLKDITILKGMSVSPDDIVVVPVGSVREGETYFFCLSAIEGNGGFIIAAPGSVYLPGSEEGQYLSSLK